VSVEIEVLGEITDEVLEAFGRLLPQLSSSARPIDGAGLRRLVLCEANTGGSMSYATSYFAVPAEHEIARLVRASPIPRSLGT
jgi:hypothetical protein